jgi:hypothetical protein
MMMIKVLWIAGLGLFFHPFGWAAKCRFELDPASVEVAWTAFKTTQKVAVKGTFTRVEVQGPRGHPSSLSGVLSKLKARIELTGEGSSQSGNPGRDATLYQHFFKHLTEKGGLRGEVATVQGGPNAGELKLRLLLNGKRRLVPMKYTRSADGLFSAKGAIDLLDFGAKAAFDDIHGACENLHKGADGISKTWSEVEIEITAKITGKSAGNPAEECSG